MQQRAFVLMPFKEEFDDIYDYLIHDPLSEAGYDVMRADDILNQRNILADIIQSIINSELIVADLSTANPNVYYELGLAHVYGKKVILLAQDIKEVPFDLQSYRIITYSTNFTQMNNARQEIQKLIEGVRDGNVKFGSPITDFGHPLSPSSTTDTQSLVEISGEQDDRGTLDYQIEVEEGMETMMEVTIGLGEHVLNPLTLELRTAADQITGPEKDSPKKQRQTMRSLAVEFDKYISWLQQGNVEYGRALGDVSQGLNAMLSGEFEVTQEKKESLIQFVDTLGNTEKVTQESRESLSDLVLKMDVLPKIEKNFHRSNRLLSAELKTFISHVEQTQSVMSRARNAAINLIEGNDQPSTASA